MQGKDLVSETLIWGSAAVFQCSSWQKTVFWLFFWVSFCLSIIDYCTAIRLPSLGRIIFKFYFFVAFDLKSSWYSYYFFPLHSFPLVFGRVLKLAKCSSLIWQSYNLKVFRFSISGLSLVLFFLFFTPGWFQCNYLFCHTIRICWFYSFESFGLEVISYDLYSVELFYLIP